MPSPFQPLSPLDGRYASKMDIIRDYFSDVALNRARIFVELRWYITLTQAKQIPELPKLTDKQDGALFKIFDQFDAQENEKIHEIETKTNHDVKAVEYYLRERMTKALGKAFKPEFLHFALTSEDVNNLAYGSMINGALQEVLVPLMDALIGLIENLAEAEDATTLLSLTHGQPATPTTLGKELRVFTDRLKRQCAQLMFFSMHGKFGGAVGNYAAHRAAYPSIDWESLGATFIAEEMGLDPLRYTTQINPHDDMAELSHMYGRINTILIDLCRDLWMYISRGVFRQKAIAGEVGSSTMPHKVNPIDFENAEGNLGLSSALFSHFAEKLPISRLQRDLSDSTVQRNIGVAFGYHVLALSSIGKGLSKLSADHARIKQELAEHPEVLTEAIQTVMRKNGITDAYEQMKALSRGKGVTKESLLAFVQTLKIDAKDKKRLVEILQAA